jgi:hypothetical protein
MEHKISLAVDGHSIHTARKIQKYLTALGGQITVSCLPPCSPDLDGWV